MAADRSRLAAALAYKQAEEERRRRMMESVPTTDNLPPVQPSRRSLRTDLENLSSGLGQGIVNQLEGVKALVTDPVGTARATYEGVKGIVRDPSVLADALRYTADKATSGPLGAGEVVGEMLGPMRGKGPMAEIDVYHGSPHRFEPEETLTVYRGENTANKGGNYWTGDPEVARQFTQSGLENEIKRSTLSSADVYTPPTPVFAGDAKAVDAAIAEARRLGKSAVRFSEGKGQPDSFYVVEKTALGRTGNPFGAFNASRIGTGEGAQAYGHGIYLAESPDVAKSYQKQLAQINPEMTVNFELPISGKSKKFAETALKDSNGNTEAAIELLKYNSQFYSSVEAKNAAREAINALKTAKITWEKDYPIGHFYTADLPDEMVDRMLDWDKPLSQQPPAVLETVMRYMNVGEKQLPPDMRVGQVGNKYVVLQDKPPLPGSTFGVGRSVVKGPKAASEQEAVAAYWNSLTGKDFYDTLGKDLGRNADASDYMRQLGIPGIKYLDAGSRGQGGSGTRNFVVFPGEEKKVKILRRE